MESGVLQGTVKFYKAPEQFGYILIPGERDVRFERSDLRDRDPPHRGDTVIFVSWLRETADAAQRS